MPAIPITSGLIVLLDSRQHTAADNDLVSTWVDQSGRGNNATASGTNRPTYKTNVIGSNPVVRFALKGMDGGLTGFGTAGSGMTVFGLMANLSAMATFGGWGAVADATNDTSTSAIICGGSSNAGRLAGYHATATFFDAVLPTPGTAMFCACGVSASNWIISVNGEAWRGSRSGAIGTSSAKYVVGGRWFAGVVRPDLGVTSDFGLFGVYNRLLTAAELDHLACWARAEFGVLSISSGGSLINSQQLVRQGWIS